MSVVRGRPPGSAGGDQRHEEGVLLVAQGLPGAEVADQGRVSAVHMVRLQEGDRSLPVAGQRPSSPLSGTASGLWGGLPTCSYEERRQGSDQGDRW